MDTLALIQFEGVDGRVGVAAAAAAAAAVFTYYSLLAGGTLRRFQGAEQTFDR